MEELAQSMEDLDDESAQLYTKLGILETELKKETEEFEEEIKNAVKKAGIEYLKPIKDIVNNKITYGQIKLYLLIRKLELEN